jgi:hypothetical protein
MTLCEFNALPYERQLAAIFDTGTFIVARRWEEEDSINFYHCTDKGCGFFVDVGSKPWCCAGAILGSS